MKGILCACLLVSLQFTCPVQAYEADIHYSTTFALARATGWTDAEAQTIASANEGVDENPETVAALELDSPSNSFHQAQKNLTLHCFSNTGGPKGQVAADVRKVMAAHFAEVPADRNDPQLDSRRLIALGVALHCQQDAYSHLGFGGSCGSYSGSCLGHTYQTFLDQVAFGVLKKHYFNPDHPGVSGQRLLDALRGTARELEVRRPQNALRPVPAKDLVALSDALRSSGLELADDVRRDCNRYVAGKWLYEFFRSARGMQNPSGAVERLAPDVATQCRNGSLASAMVVSIPEPRFPRLNADGSPFLVRADGTYQRVREGAAGVFVARIDAEGIAGRVANYRDRQARLQVSHWSQLLSMPLVTGVAR